MNVDYFGLSYNQMGLIATVELNECDDNFVAWQRFLPDGVIALLPLSDKLSSIVWSTSVPHFKHLMQLNEVEFIDAVNNAFVCISFLLSIFKEKYFPFLMFRGFFQIFRIKNMKKFKLLSWLCKVSKRF